MAAIDPRRMALAFHLATVFFQRLQALGYPESVYHLINWNHMPPAGSSLIHSHIQVFASTHAPNLMRQELHAARIHWEKHGSNFWDALVEHEKQAGERYLGRIGRTHWLMSFAPMGVAGDVTAIVEDARTTLELAEEDLASLADDLACAMAAYDAMGIYSFNMNIFTGADGDDHARVHLVFSPRTFFNQALAATDVGALRNLYNETICMARPEAICDMLLPYFQ